MERWLCVRTTGIPRGIQGAGVLVHAVEVLWLLVICGRNFDILLLPRVIVIISKAVGWF
jgi:hypothetical protein